MKKKDYVREDIEQQVNIAIEELAWCYQDSAILVNTQRLRKYLYLMADKYYCKGFEDGLKPKPKKINKRVRK